jgi:hypothetical protein
MDPPAEPENDGTCRKLFRGARAVLGDAQDQVGHTRAGVPVQSELPANVLGCPESHDLHQPVAGLFGAVLEREIRKYELGPHRDWLGLP